MTAIFFGSLARRPDRDLNVSTPASDFWILSKYASAGAL